MQLMNWAMSKNKKNNEFSIFVLVLLFVGKYVYDMNINHNFETITEGKYINQLFLQMKSSYVRNTI
jgi:type IV secretory pathway TrbL component